MGSGPSLERCLRSTSWMATLGHPAPRTHVEPPSVARLDVVDVGVTPRSHVDVQGPCKFANGAPFDLIRAHLTRTSSASRMPFFGMNRLSFSDGLCLCHNSG